MAERLPGLIDPNLPPDQQPLHDSSNPTTVAHPPVALHPDRFTPGNAPGAVPDATSAGKPDSNAPAEGDAATQPKAQKPAMKPGALNPLLSETRLTCGKPASRPAQPKQTGPQTGKPPQNGQLGRITRCPCSAMTAAIRKFDVFPSWLMHWCRWRPGVAGLAAARHGPVCLVRPALVVTVYFALDRRSLSKAR